MVESYLKQAIDELAAHIVLVVSEECRVDQTVAAAGNVVFGVEEAVGRELEEGAQTVVDLLVRVALRVQKRVQALPERAVVFTSGSHILAGFQSPSRSLQLSKTHHCAEHVWSSSALHTQACERRRVCRPMPRHLRRPHQFTSHAVSADCNPSTTFS